MPEDSAPSVSAESSSVESPEVSAESASSSNAEGRETVHSISTPANGAREQPATRKESRYERTKRERAEFRAQQATFQREREAFAQEREVFARERAAFVEAQKPKRDYTLADLRKYRAEWARDVASGNWRDGYDPAQLVQKADAEIAAMEAEEQAERAARTVEMPRFGSPEHRAMWESEERAIAQSDPDFMKEGTRLDGKLREIMKGPDGNIYRQHPRGIVAAYHRAKMELLEADTQGLRTENSRLKNELQRLTGLTSIDGGAPGVIGNGSEVAFDRLPTKDMRNHLLRSAKRNSLQLF